jgi:hypothetical protein
MGKETPNSRHMRGRIAHLAARLMAVDGIDDYALAKRKAARQAGAPETRNLPTNEEVEDALRAYRQLYQAEEQDRRVRDLRSRALEMMKLLAPFNPFLSGSVLSGSAGKYSDIEIHLFTDSSKNVEMFLVNQGIPYKTRDRRIYVGETPRPVPSLLVSLEDADFDITVFSSSDLRTSLRSTAEGKPFDRARVDWLESVLNDRASS